MAEPLIFSAVTTAQKHTACRQHTCTFEWLYAQWRTRTGDTEDVTVLLANLLLRSLLTIKSQ